MKKKDLRTGMVVENNEGNKYLVILDINEGVIVRDGMFDDLSEFNDELVNMFTNLTIKRVYERGYLSNLLSLKHGELLWEREEDKFKDLKRAYSEGARIECANPGESNWDDIGDGVSPLWLDALQYRIKGNISIESWDKHKEVIKEYWNGKEIEMDTYANGWETITVSSNGGTLVFFSSNKYRVKEQKTEELTVEQIEAKLGYKIKIVGEK